MRYIDNAKLHFALLHNALTLLRIIFASIIYCSEHIGAIIAS